MKCKDGSSCGGNWALNVYQKVNSTPHRRSLKTKHYARQNGHTTFWKGTWTPLLGALGSWKLSIPFIPKNTKRQGPAWWIQALVVRSPPSPLSLSSSIRFIILSSNAYILLRQVSCPYVSGNGPHEHSTFFSPPLFHCPHPSFSLSRPVYSILLWTSGWITMMQKKKVRWCSCRDDADEFFFYWLKTGVFRVIFMRSHFCICIPFIVFPWDFRMRHPFHPSIHPSIHPSTHPFIHLLIHRSKQQHIFFIPAK